MPSPKLYNSFVAQKVSKIRFVHEQFDDSKSFVTGSWWSSSNLVNLWRFTKDEYLEEDDDTDYIPQSISKIPVNGDVTGLEFLDYNNLAVSTTSPNAPVFIVNIQRNMMNDALLQTHTFNNIHKFNSLPAACTALSVCENDIASVGEDGTLNVLSAEGRIIKQFPNVDSCSMTAVAFINHKEILTGNRIGTMNIFDSGNHANRPVFSLSIPAEDEKRTNGITCITYHPTQKHIVICGSEEGSLTVWDLRNPVFPASYLKALESLITDVAFHHTDPTKLFAASDGGDLFQWNHKTNEIAERIEGKSIDSDNVNPWLCGDRTKNKVVLQTHLKGIQKSINALDSNGSKLICGSNNEAVYLIDNI